MRVARSLDEASGFAPSMVTIGNFDGVHAGHRYLIRRVTDGAFTLNVRPTVLTFDPHPAVVVAPERAPRLLTTIEERLELMASLGIEQVLVLPFTPAVASLTPEKFVDQILKSTLGARSVLVGENFRFGCRQAGDVHALIRLGAAAGFDTTILGSVKKRGRVVSSSEIRKLVEAGNVALAGRLLDRCYALSGEVVAGHGIGSKQTVPTLNLKSAAEVLPADGVYITRTEDLNTAERWDSITNVGHRPTFDGGDLSIETYLLSPLDGSPPVRIRVEFLRRVREERKFASPEELKRQILKDVARAQVFFRRYAHWVH